MFDGNAPKNNMFRGKNSENFRNIYMSRYIHTRLFSFSGDRENWEGPKSKAFHLHEWQSKQLNKGYIEESAEPR